ncbi:hypothetical protein CAOG_01449 [Capsaspora owczarzaki ATCC 30864]|uniref:Uncharacterized protein n=1 Tax=Capsaspora owczarzaki (strain ATCC 30864) TaxID=595528 RepID=A0A0D2X126_CAPO3|nr:hypothetical protein CAOG_01449 [Capsaspora owczarzaki ATCC 30864]KJE90074.1 hypothetical protein CAOG_001449 [Capsaspora owczarzaki ATCC 30864]|eukprot:XP_004364317.1 hypothetical protein CAOG_01449 [Capsaspora owczarzaki ATCC 30864]
MSQHVSADEEAAILERVGRLGISLGANEAVSNQQLDTTFTGRLPGAGRPGANNTTFDHGSTLSFSHNALRAAAGGSAGANQATSEKRFASLKHAEAQAMLVGLLAIYDEAWNWNAAELSDAANYKRISKHLTMLELGHLARSASDLDPAVNAKRVARVVAGLLDKIEARHGPSIYRVRQQQLRRAAAMSVGRPRSKSASASDASMLNASVLPNDTTLNTTNHFTSTKGALPAAVAPTVAPVVAAPRAAAAPIQAARPAVSASSHAPSHGPTAASKPVVPTFGRDISNISSNVAGGKSAALSKYATQENPGTLHKSKSYGNLDESIFSDPNFNPFQTTRTLARTPPCISGPIPPTIITVATAFSPILAREAFNPFAPRHQLQRTPQKTQPPTTENSVIEPATVAVETAAVTGGVPSPRRAYAAVAATAPVANVGEPLPVQSPVRPLPALVNARATAHLNKEAESAAHTVVQASTTSAKAAKSPKSPKSPKSKVPARTLPVAAPVTVSAVVAAPVLNAAAAAEAPVVPAPQAVTSSTRAAPAALIAAAAPAPEPTSVTAIVANSASTSAPSYASMVKSPAKSPRRAADRRIIALRHDDFVPSPKSQYKTGPSDGRASPLRNVLATAVPMQDVSPPRSRTSPAKAKLQAAIATALPAESSTRRSSPRRAASMVSKPPQSQDALELSQRQSLNCAAALFKEESAASSYMNAAAAHRVATAPVPPALTVVSNTTSSAMMAPSTATAIGKTPAPVPRAASPRRRESPRKQIPASPQRPQNEASPTANWLADTLRQTMLELEAATTLESASPAMSPALSAPNSPSSREIFAKLRQVNTQLWDELVATSPAPRVASPKKAPTPRATTPASASASAPTPLAQVRTAVVVGPATQSPIQIPSPVSQSPIQSPVQVPSPVSQMTQQPASLTHPAPAARSRPAATTISVCSRSALERLVRRTELYIQRYQTLQQTRDVLDKLSGLSLQ